MAHRTQESILHTFMSLLQRMQLRNGQMEEMHRARCGGGMWSFWPSSGAPPSTWVVHWPKALQVSLFWSFYRAPSPAPHPNTPTLQSLGDQASWEDWWQKGFLSVLCYEFFISWFFISWKRECLPLTIKLLLVSVLFWFWFKSFILGEETLGRLCYTPKPTSG